MTRELTANLQAVLAELFRRADGSGLAVLFQSELCQAIKLPQKTVSNAFTILERRGYLTRLARGARNTKGRYRLRVKRP